MCVKGGTETLLQFVPRKVFKAPIVKLDGISITIVSRILIQCKPALTNFSFSRNVASHRPS